MIAVPAGHYCVGSDAHYPEERPARQIALSGFRLDRGPVSIGAFAQFVAQTGYVTQAECADPPGSAAFVMSAGPVDLRQPANWWRFALGANWRSSGADRGEDLAQRADHPVTHVTHSDALAFAAWRGARLPSENEWEAAARLGAGPGPYAWGEAFAPSGVLRANVWTGAFPYYFARKGPPGTSAIGSFAPTQGGFLDLIGNVWEWTATPFLPQEAPICGCGPQGKNSPAAVWTLKGGSFLCAGEYCARYRPSARIGAAAGDSTAHIGFRCAADD